MRECCVNEGCCVDEGVHGKGRCSGSAGVHARLRLHACVVVTLPACAHPPPTAPQSMMIMRLGVIKPLETRKFIVVSRQYLGNTESEIIALWKDVLVRACVRVWVHGYVCSVQARVHACGVLTDSVQRQVCVHMVFGVQVCVCVHVCVCVCVCVCPRMHDRWICRGRTCLMCACMRVCLALALQKSANLSKHCYATLTRDPFVPALQKLKELLAGTPAKWHVCAYAKLWSVLQTILSSSPSRHT